MILMRALELFASVAVRPPAGGHAMSKGPAYSQCPARRRPSAARRVPAAGLHQGRLIGGRPHGTPGDQAVRPIHPSTTYQSPKTRQDRERGDELTARVFAPGRSILSTMGAML